MNTLTFTVPNVREPQYRNKRTVVRITPEAYNRIEDVSAQTGLSIAFIASQMILFAGEHMEIKVGGDES